MSKRVFIIVLDSFGVGFLPDADKFGDVGCNTLKSISTSKEFSMPNMKRLGFFNIDGVDYLDGVDNPAASFGRSMEKSMGKDTTIGHWEIAGIISPEPLPTFPNGFPDEVIKEFEQKTGRRVVCNKPYSGTAVIDDYADEHLKDGALIVYTSADSVFQIAAHEDIVPVEELYRYCEIARQMLRGKYGVGRVIARPFVGTKGAYTRTANRHDFSLEPPKKTVIDYIKDAGLDTIGVGKIYDIFAGQGIEKTTRIKSNLDGMNVTIEQAKEDFHGLCFVNLVDFDMVYGHRRNIDGYAGAATEFDGKLAELLPLLKDDDMLIVTADHGCDPGFSGTDHTREYIPIVVYGKNLKAGVNLGTRSTYADIAATTADYLGVKADIAGTSFLKEIEK